MRKSTWDKPHTFAEAVQYLSEGHGIDYEVEIDTHHGALMTRQEWLDDVKHHSLVDDDGMGNQVDASGNILKTGTFGDWVQPSEAGTLLPECAYILWYNK